MVRTRTRLGQRVAKRSATLTALLVVAVVARTVGEVLAAQAVAPRPPLSDDVLRSWAVHSPTPRYPSEARRLRVAGVVVVALQIASDGAVLGIRTLEAPDITTAEAVLEAVKEWRFRPPREESTQTGQTVRVYSGTLTFYFWRAGGRYVVGGPLDAPRMARSISIR